MATLAIHREHETAARRRVLQFAGRTLPRFEDNRVIIDGPIHQLEEDQNATLARRDGDIAALTYQRISSLAPACAAFPCTSVRLAIYERLQVRYLCCSRHCGEEWRDTAARSQSAVPPTWYRSNLERLHLWLMYKEPYGDIYRRKFLHRSTAENQNL